MYEFEFKCVKEPERDIIFWNPTRMSETIAHLDEWDGYESSIQSIDIDGSIATISFTDNCTHAVRTAIFELDTSSNIAEKL